MSVTWQGESEQVALDDVRVLHVDDDPEFVDLVATYLEREAEAIETVPVTSVGDALDRLDDGRVDCIVSDHDMAGTTGIEFLETVRETRPDLPFILFTGRGSEAVASEAISAGVTDYLQKGTGTEQYELLANRITNVVAQYRAQAAAERTERRLRELAENTPDARWMFSADWSELLFINSAYEELFGRPTAELAATPTAFLDAVHPDDRPAVTDAMQRLSDGAPVELEYRVDPDADYGRWARVQGKPIRDEDGEVVRVVGYTRDVTEQEQREEELEQYEQILETMGEAVYALDPDRHLTAVNGWMERLTGYDREELVGEHVSLLLDEADISTGRRAVQELLAEPSNRVTTYEEPIRTADGDTVPCAVRQTLLPADDGSFRGSVGTLRDVTEAKAHERKLTALHEVAVDLDSIETVDGICERTVEASEDVLEFDLSVIDIEEDGFLAKRAISAEISPEDTAGMSVEEGIAGKTYRTGESMLLDDIEAHDEANPQGPFQSGISVPIGDHGIFQAVAEAPAAFDESDLELAELLVSHAESALSRLDRERRLERQNERLQEFASIVSHDLRNPLNVAQGSVDLLRAERDGERLETAARAHERMAAIIDDLLVLSREGEPVHDCEPVGLAAAAERCWQNVETHGATLRVDTDATILADSGRLQQLLENLFRNAVEHGSTNSRPSANDTVEHAGAGVTVTVTDLADGFSVTDDGPGVPPAERERVFDPGYSTTDGGTGFGLHICERVAEAHGWTISVTDGADGGARFDVEGVTFD